MARRANSIERLSALAVKSHVTKASTTKPLHDGGGLYLRVFSKNWYWYLRGTSPSTGRRTWTPIRPGVPYPATTLEMARAEARGMRANVAKGNEAGDERKERVRVAKENQAAEANARLRTISLRQVFTRWQAVDLKPQLRADGTRSGRKDGGKYVEEQFERHVFPELGDHSIANLTRAEVLAVLDKQKAAGKLRTANVLLASLKQLFRFAADREIIPVSPI